MDDTYGRFEDSPEWTNDDYVEFCWLLADNEHGRFYSNVDELVARSRTLSRGERPQNFYVVEDDYLAGEPNEPERLQHAYELCDLIHLLSAISLVDDTSTATSPKKLIFVIPAGEKAPPRTLSLSTKLEPSTLAENRLNLLPLRRIASDENSHALHIHEHRSLFRLAVADAIGRAPSDVNTFTFLINCWPEVLEKYAFDIDCFVSNFSFEKVRLEIAQMELDFSGKISSVMGDSAAKFLGLPLPLAVLAVIYKTEGIIEAYLLFLGAILVVLLFSGMTHNQLLQLARIDHGFNIIFDQFKKKIKSYPASIAGRLEQAERGFAKQRSFLVRTLWLLRVLAWLPIAMGLALLAWKFHPGFQQWMVRQIPLWP
ncbi:hypothetical protein [Chitinimonas koreensis]|uniref:hypothetical protein n=1 Tax=Chitinimonas koreensis TaxID=356302 RepID=UPI0012FAD4C6|nr:hypothetical protein [Chitinimonas koreensis]QNM96742.1 hypothetical protein H9L41_23860 [Chitinimonas koreensis]